MKQQLSINCVVLPQDESRIHFTHSYNNNNSVDSRHNNAAIQVRNSISIGKCSNLQSYQHKIISRSFHCLTAGCRV